MRSPRCAPLLLLLLLPPLRLTPPAGDAAVITGVSCPGAPVCLEARPRGAQGAQEGDRKEEARGVGRDTPSGHTCLSCLLAHLEKWSAPKQQTARDI